MRIFIAGATGAIGRPLTQRLVRRGHEVVGTTRSPERTSELRALGAEPVVMDALDPASVKDAVAGAAPEVIVHQLTAIPPTIDTRRFAETFAPTNRLRTEGTDHLLEAAAALGVRRIVAQSYAAWPYERRGGWVKSEEDPLDPDPPAGARSTVEALRHLESAVRASGREWVVLRYGGFYGPGTSLARGTPTLELVRRRRFPIVGTGSGVWSFVHIEDAADATVLAIEGGGSEVYNVVDDDPAPVREWLPELARVIGARPPRRLPAWLARPLIGDVGVVMMTEIRGASNAKARSVLGWSPRFATWREGFRGGLG